jgi:hypothetical protein
MFHLNTHRMFHLNTRQLFHLKARQMFHLQARRMLNRRMFHLQARWMFHLQARRMFHLQNRRMFHPQNRRMHLLGPPSASIFAIVGSIVTLMFPKNFSFLATLNSANHGHVLTRKLAFLISIAKQVLERKTMNFRFNITNSRFSRTDFTMHQIHPERKYFVADVPTYQLKVHSILGILHACCLNPKYECSILEILSATPLSTLGTLITLNTSAELYWIKVPSHLLILLSTYKPVGSTSLDPFIRLFCDDGEHIDSNGPTAPPWTQFEVTLKDENRNTRLDSKGDPITVIAPPPSELQGRVFLTKPDEHGDIKRACVVEIMKQADANDLEHKQLLEYKVFIHNGQFMESNILNGYRQMRTFDANSMHDVSFGKAVTRILHLCTQLNKRHNVLSFHYVRGLMACGLINLQHIKSEANVSNILSKHWGYQACWELIRPIFHFGGDTGKSTTVSDLRNFHDGECYHNVEIFPRWFKRYHDFRCKGFLRWGVIPRCGSTDDLYDMTGDVTNNHTRITTPIDLISSTDITILSPLSVINALD